MADVLMLVVVAGFFGACLAYVSLCDRIVGPDGELGGAESVPDEVTA